MSISRWWMCSLSAWPIPFPRHVRRTIGEHDVQERDREHEQRHDDGDRDRREVAPARRERVAPHARDRGDRQEHAEQHRARVPHEDLRRDRSSTGGTRRRARGDRRQERGGRGVAEQALGPDHVDEERDGRDRDHPGGEPVEAVDEVDGVHHERHPQDRERHREVRAERDDALAREPEVQELHAEQHQHARRASTCPASFPSAETPRCVVDRPRARRSPCTATSAASGSELPWFMSGEGREDPRDAERRPATPTKIASPPVVGVGFGCTLRSDGWSIEPNRSASRRTRASRRTSSPALASEDARGRRSRCARVRSAGAPRNRAVSPGRRGTACIRAAPAPGGVLHRRRRPGAAARRR